MTDHHVTIKLIIAYCFAMGIRQEPLQSVFGTKQDRVSSYVSCSKCDLSLDKQVKENGGHVCIFFVIP